MNLTPMSYRSYVWPGNPETIKIERARNTAQFKIPGETGVVQEAGTAPRKVSGSGRFTGSGCMEEFQRLSAVLASGGSGMLCLPGAPPFSAVFVSLVMKGVPRPNCVEYEFLFLEDASSDGKDPSALPEVYVCAGGETLWDVANRYGTDVDALRAANPQIEWPNALQAGERVTVA
jgi:LysM repeat protein